MRVLSIDLGVTGAYTLWYEDEPTKVDDLVVVSGRLSGAWLAQTIADENVEQVVVERIHAMPVVGSKGNFTQGMSLGVTNGVCSALDRPLHEVAPTAWKRAVGLGKDKDAAREMAARIYPQHAELLRRKKDHNRAESILLGYAFVERGVR